jgi:hypothetical protein
MKYPVLALALFGSLSTLQPAVAGKFATCDEFRARLPQAEKVLKMPVPKITFNDEGTVADLHDFSIPDLQNFTADLRCLTNGSFSSLQIQQVDRDPYSAKRFVALATASVWAYTGWSQDKIKEVLKHLAKESNQNLEASAIRGDKIKDGRADYELDPDGNLQMSGGETGLWFMIDASAEK